MLLKRFLVLSMCFLCACNQTATKSDAKDIIGGDNIQNVDPSSSKTFLFLKNDGYVAIGRLDKGNCTITHIGNNYAVTAGHCVLDDYKDDPVKNVNCSNSIEWGVLDGKQPVKKSKCQSLVYGILNLDADIALLKLDSAPKAFHKMDPRPTKQSLRLAVIGYPNDRPLSVSAGCYMRFSTRHAPTKPFFVHTCDTLGGSSGSPVFELESKKIIGFHFSGREISNTAILSKFIFEKLDHLGVELPENGAIVD